MILRPAKTVVATGPKGKYTLQAGVLYDVPDEVGKHTADAVGNNVQHYGAPYGGTATPVTYT